MKWIRRSTIGGAVSFAVFLGLLPWVGEGATVSIDCAVTSIRSSLPSLRPGDTLRVSGVCNEDVFIGETFSNITLDGQGAAKIIGQDPVGEAVRIQGARAITLRGFVITGTREGIAVLRGAIALIDNNTIENLEGGAGGQVPVSGSGIFVGPWAFARIINNTIQNNREFGILVRENSSARIGFLTTDNPTALPNTIQNNRMGGIAVSRSSNARIVGNTINNNGGDGILVNKGSHADIAANHINGNSGDGIHVTGNSGVDTIVSSGEHPLFALPNDTTVLNGGFGLGCSIGGMPVAGLGLSTEVRAR
jgi:parallel beta-helix repeat protein